MKSVYRQCLRRTSESDICTVNTNETLRRDTSMHCYLTTS